MAVQNVVVIVGDVWMPAGASQLARQAQRGKAPASRRPAKWHDLDRQWDAASQAGYELASVHHHDEPASGGRHDLFPQQGAAAPFDQVQLRIHLIDRKSTRLNS